MGRVSNRAHAERHTHTKLHLSNAAAIFHIWLGFSKAATGTGEAGNTGCRSDQTLSARGACNT